jgi:hypothetical protein
MPPRSNPCRVILIWLSIFVAVFFVTNCTYQSEEVQQKSQNIQENNSYKVFALNRRGMAFPDNDFSVSAIFPPANFLVAQVVNTNVKSDQDSTGKPQLLNSSAVEVRYTAVPDINGSINTTSTPKINFWHYANTIYDFYMSNGVAIEPDQGFYGATMHGQRMPGVDNTAQAFTLFDAATATFTAAYVPVTPIDDDGAKNYFPLYRIDAVDKETQQILASTVIPVPMAEPMNCERCHATGGVAANALTSQRHNGLVWSDNPNLANNAKENIAILHGSATGLNITARQPYLCAECHYSPVADPDGKGPVSTQQTLRNALSISVHALHGLDRDRQLPASNADALIPENGQENCKICHGGDQPYTRGAMYNQGIVCQDCHGGMIAVGKSPLAGAAETRTPFADEPRCESCHTGDELSHIGSELVMKQAYEANDPFATPRLATNRRFAEQPGTLYRSSTGHGGIACISCHGSPHAIWPVVSEQTYDNNITKQLQGHAGSIIECDACHQDNPDLSTAGPHGLHNINDANWVKNHGGFFNANPVSACQTCHGIDLQGGRLAKAASARTFTLPDNSTVSYSKDQPVGCTDCHAKPTITG